MTTTTDALALSEDELARHRKMARMAADDERDDWTAAGITTGARVADVGCGPGAILAVLAETIGPTGAALGVDRDPRAVRHAHDAIAAFPNAAAHTGDAHLSGLPVGEFDVAMCRNVLAHNGDRERVIVAHLAALVRPGGAVYLVDRDVRVGRRLGTLLDDAGLVVEPCRRKCVAIGRRPLVG